MIFIPFNVKENLKMKKILKDLFLIVRYTLYLDCWMKIGNIIRENTGMSAVGKHVIFCK